MTATGAWPRCSFIADAADDPREGTAPPADRWFLVEHPGPWGRVALAQSGVHPAAVAAISAWAAAEGGRAVLVRKPGRAPRNETPARPGPGLLPGMRDVIDGAGTPIGGRRRWFRVDSRPGHESIRTGTFVDESELVPAVHAPGERYAGQLSLVCAHGRHDTCCAVRGRPLAAALTAAEPGSVWESSHIGGCRFAPALVLLPHGYVFGGLPAAEGPAVVRAYAEGRVEPRWLRGRSSLPPAVQAAQHHCRAATGASGVDALRLVDVKSEQQADGSRVWHVELSDPACSVRLRERRVETGRPLTCAATAPGWMRLFDLIELTAPGAVDHRPRSSGHTAG
ncbi:MAG TPA: sucrase ferredoxin [Pseudonocardia sp.]|nr:sucrase ferredoxin [Pseudonocardia sp.]